MPVCYIHPDSEAVGACVKCGNFICSACDVILNEKHYCKRCVGETIGRGSLERKLTLSRGDMEKHVTIVGALHIGFGALGILVAIIFFLVAVAGVARGVPAGIVIIAVVGSALFALVSSVPGIIGGIGLLKKRSWARILVLILAVLDLMNIPVGTVVGIYTLWVLMQDETARLFASGLTL